MNQEEKREKLVQIVLPRTSWIALVGEKGVTAILCPFRAKPDDGKSLMTAHMPEVARQFLTTMGTLPALHLSSRDTLFRYGYYGDWGENLSLSLPPGVDPSASRGLCASWVRAVWEGEGAPVTLAEIEAAMGAYAADRHIGAWVEWGYLCEIAGQGPALGDS